MNQKTVIVVIVNDGLPECYGSFKKFCIAKGINYQTMLNKKTTPRIGNSLTIQGFEIHKVECK